ncbi:MAG TPA: PilZ domain-containing protein [Candidatus Acidoferrales bacterium]|nr:PilZ domain-containing protein [Candidatus Acidoferrales bacterium]
MSTESTIPNARAFVRSLNVLFKYARLYGLDHARSATQFEITWNELGEALRASGDAGLLLGASGSQLLLDGVPLEATQAERSFAELLNSSGVASIAFHPHVERQEFENLVRAFIESNPKAGSLSDRLEFYFGKNTSGGVRVNEIRFVAEDAAFSEARVAAQLTAKTLGADADRVQDWFRSPEKMIQLIAAAEGAHGGPGSGPGAGPGSGPGSGGESGTGAGTGGATTSGLSAGTGGATGTGSGGDTGAGAGTASAGGYLAGGAAGGSATVQPLSETEMQNLLRLLAQFGEATHGNNPQQLDPTTWQQKLASLPQNAQVTLRQALASVVAKTPSAKIDETTLLRLAEDLAIRFALDRFQRGEVRVNAVRQMLDKMSGELETLRKLLKAREDKMAAAGLSVESHADVLDRQFWAAVPESGKRAVLTSSEAWCIPPRNVQQYVEELMGRGESDAAADILLKYAACVRNKDAEARKKAAIGLGQLAELYSKAASQRLQDALAQIGQQLAAEKDAELQTLLSAAFVRLSQESASRRYYRAMQQALDSLADLEEIRPTWAQSLRPRIGVENRIAEFIEEALSADAMPEGLVGVLMRVPQAAGEQLAVRLARAGRRSERESIVELAKTVGTGCTRHLREMLKSEQPAKAATIVGLLSRLDPSAVDDLLPLRLRHGGRGFHDAVIRQLSVAGAPERGQLLANLLEKIDPMVLPLALDEIGMCGDPVTAPKLLRLAEGDILQQGAEYLRVKAIEALGRMRATAAAGHLRRFVESRKAFGWAYPEEIRTAAAQALVKLDPEWIQAFLPHSGLDAKVMALAPLDPIPDRDVVRHRRYRRIRLPRSVPAVITSPRGKYSSAISVLSLEGGLLSGDIQLAVGTEATLKIPAGLRSINMQAVVRFVRSHQAGFEMVGMGLEDRAKLRRLLVSLGGPDPAVMQSPTGE